MRTEIARKRSTYGDYDVVVFRYDSVAVGAELQVMAEVPVDGELSEITTVFSSCRTGESMHSDPLPFTKFATNLVDPYLSRGSLIILGGLGAGLLHTGLLSKMSGARVITLEPDKTVVELAREHFGFKGEVEISTFESAFNRFGKVDSYFINAFSAFYDTNPTSMCDNARVRELTLPLKKNGAIFLNLRGGLALPDETRVFVKQELHYFTDEYNGEPTRFAKLMHLT